MGSRFIRILIEAYVEVIRNTPFLVQLFILVFGLPGIGIWYKDRCKNCRASGHDYQSGDLCNRDYPRRD